MLTPLKPPPEDVLMDEAENVTFPINPPVELLCIKLESHDASEAKYNIIETVLY